MKPYTGTKSMMFRHPPRFLSLELSKYEPFPTEPSNSMKSYEVNIMRSQGRTRTCNQRYFHSCSPHIKMPTACHMGEVISDQILLKVWSHSLILVRLINLEGSKFYWCEGEKEKAESHRGT